jgi:hypothetical protein
MHRQADAEGRAVVHAHGEPAGNGVTDVTMLARFCSGDRPTSVDQHRPDWKTKRLTAISSSMMISTTPFGKRRTSSGPPNPFR